VPIRLVLADDHPVVLQGLERLFGQDLRFQVLQSCRDGNEALAAVRAHQPDVLVLDLRMPKLSGVDVLRAMAEERLPSRVVVLSAVLDDEDLVELLRLGVMGIMGKEASPEALVDCIRRVHEGKKAIDRDIAAGASDRVLRRESAEREIAATLTLREIEIVRNVAEGLRNREIAGRLSISEGTVKIHLHHIYEKLGVDTRVGLVLYAQEKGFL
jgi:DNA-binding NarL/FixJ family response regulator